MLWSTAEMMVATVLLMISAKDKVTIRSLGRGSFFVRKMSKKNVDKMMSR